MQHQNQSSEMSSFLEDESRTSSDMILQPAKIAGKVSVPATSYGMSLALIIAQ